MKNQALWSNPVRHEAVQLLKKLWGDIDDSQRCAIIDAILEGPPRELYRKDLNAEDFAQVRDSEIWTWLAIIKGFNAEPLPDIGEEAFRRYQEVHPDWKLEPWIAEGFVSWSLGGGAFAPPSLVSARELIGMGTDKLVQGLRSGSLDASAETWRQVTSEKPELMTKVLGILAADGVFPPVTWNGMLQALPNFERDDLIFVLETLYRLPEQLFVDVMPAIAGWLSIRCRGLSVDDEPSLWPLWFRVTQSALESKERTRGEEHTERSRFRIARLATKEKIPGQIEDIRHVAINDPVGQMAEVLINRLWAGKPEPNSRLGRLEKAFTLLADSQARAALLGKVVFASSLHTLFVVDRDWTDKHLIPYFRWDAGQEARAIWDGYLFYPGINLALLHRLKRDLLVAFSHMESLRNSGNLCILLASLGLELPEGLSTDETRDAIRKMGPDGRHKMTAWLGSRIRPVKRIDVSAGALSSEERDQSDVTKAFVVERVIPWLLRVWPPESQFLDETVSANIAVAISYAGDGFPIAVDRLKLFWKQTGQVDRLFHVLTDLKQPERYPQETLELISRLLKEPLQTYEASGLESILTTIAYSNPSLRDDHRFKALHEAALRAQG